MALLSLHSDAVLTVSSEVNILHQNIPFFGDWIVNKYSVII